MTAGRVPSDIKHIPHDEKIYYPQNVEEVKELILFAKENHYLVRAVGSGHSPKASIYGENENEIKLCLDGDLRKIDSFAIDESKTSATVTVGAGCYLGLNPNDKKSTLENSFNKQVDDKGFALPTTGGISHQSIAGFLQTSSSGGSAKHNIADVIEEIEWVNGNGEICRAKKGEENFNAVGVSMGLLGVITHVTFKLPPKYCVEGIENNHNFEDSYLAEDKEGHHTALDKALFVDNEYIHINWFPQKYVRRVTHWTGHAVSPDSKITPYHHPLESTFMSALAASVLMIGNKLSIIGTDLAERLLSLLLKPFVLLSASQEFCDVWYKALPIDDQAPVEHLMSISFSELWFPRARIDDVMDALEDLVKNNPEAAGNFMIELYCAKQSPFMLSPSEGCDAFRVDLYWYDHNRWGNANHYFGFFWEKLLSIPGARLHWGKNLPHIGEKYGDFVFTPQILQKNYQKLPDFLKIREKMDPDQIFVTPDYWGPYLGIPALKKETSLTESGVSFFVVDKKNSKLFENNETKHSLGC